jgi:hypothetical protein
MGCDDGQSDSSGIDGTASDMWRPIKYSLFPPLGLATLAGYLRDDDDAALAEIDRLPGGTCTSWTITCSGSRVSPPRCSMGCAADSRETGGPDAARPRGRAERIRETFEPIVRPAPEVSNGPVPNPFGLS